MKTCKYPAMFWRILKKSNNDKGFTLLEVLISVTILAIIIAPLLAVFTSSITTTALSQDILDGTYISQNIYERMLADDYRTLLKLSSDKQSFDSDGNGTDDCYVQVILYPDGVYSSLTPEPNPSYLHINFVDDEIILFGDSGTSSTINTGTQIASLADISITNSSTSPIVQVQVGNQDIMRFTKKYVTCPVVVVANLFNKSIGSQDVTLSIIGDAANITVVEYAREQNYNELICSQLSIDNVYYGINDYSTTLIHAYVQVFDFDDNSKRFGLLEGTFETYIS